MVLPLPTIIFFLKTNGGSLLNKPDLTAADGVSTTLPSSSGLNPFFGTSCTGPHAGAIAALIWSANPSLTTAQIRNILTTTALDIEGAGYDHNSGYGIVQAFQAIQFALPLTWLNFTASLQPNQQVLVQWQVGNELNVNHYEIESGVDGVHFSTLQNVDASSVSASVKTYQGYDNFPSAGNNYYRIKEVDKDGKSTYSKIARYQYQKW